MEAGLNKIILLKRKRNLLKLLPKWKLIDEKSTAEILLKYRPDSRKILVNESGIFYKINIIFCAELSSTNCRAELSNAELSAPNCPRRNVRAELSCAELSGHRYCMDGYCMDGYCMDGYCMDGYCMNGYCMDGYCIDGYCMDGY